MTTRDDILAIITEGRLDAQRARATALSRALSEVEDLVREMRPTVDGVVIERGNTADLADSEDMRSLLMEQGQEPSAAGLAEFIRFARMGEDEKDKAKKEAEAARERLIYITDGDPAATLAELVSTAGEALNDAQNAQDRLAGRDVSIVQAQKTIAAALGTSPLNRLDCLAADVTETMAALRRALGCPDGASAGQIVAEAALLQKEASTMAADRALIVQALDRAIDPEGNGPTGDTIDERVEEVVSVFHAQAAAIEGMHGVIRERDARIAALTPGPWTRLGDTTPDEGEIVLMHTGSMGTSPWVQFVSKTTAQCVSADYLWRPLPAGLLDVPAPTVAP